METDVAVLGGGAAGLAAAREAIRRGGRAVIVNDGPLGGDCTFTGCVPSKSVIEASRAGLTFSDAFDRARSVVERIASTETAEVLRGEGIEVIEGEGTLRPGPAIDVMDGVTRRVVRAEGVVVATGSRPFVPPIDGVADAGVLTTESLWETRSAPSSMAIIGGGAIGCELAQALAGFGVEVTVIEMADRLLVKEEPEAAAIVARSLTAAGVKVLTGATVAAVRRTDGASGSARTVSLADGRSFEVDEVLMAVGRRPNTDRGGLAEAGIEMDRRGFVVNGDDLATSVDGVYVAGDVSGKLMFTHAAYHMGMLATTNIMSRWSRLRPARFHPERIPWVTFTDPEVGRIGMSETEAADLDGAMVAFLPLDEHDRAITAEATEGYIKLIAGPRPVVGSAGGGRLIGATVVAERAGELMGELSLAVRTGAFVGRLAQTVHAYPTWSYGIPKAAGQFFTTIEGRTARPPRRSPLG